MKNETDQVFKLLCYKKYFDFDILDFDGEYKSNILFCI